MHHPIFGHSFAVLVAPILLFGLAFYFLNKKKASVPGNAKDADAGASANSCRLSSSQVETNDSASCSSSTETDNGASSSSTTSTGNCYEVFLNFRGPDTRDGFTSHLYGELVRRGIHAFRDDDELSQGKNIGPELTAAITNSKILIPVLSVTYGTSSWCLNELVRIMECEKNDEQTVLPIFYKVKPAEVGHQTGSFGDAFRERERRLLKRPSFDSTILGKWKKALAEVSKLKGYEAIGDEAKLVESVSQRVLRELKKKFELVNFEDLVGIDNPVKEVMEFVDNKSHATLFIGIYGMGGIGKTTLAKAISDKLSNQIEYRCFIADIRESWKHHVHHLQNQLIYDILKLENGVHSEIQGTDFISSRFKHKKVLVILDDVDDVYQLKCFAGDRDWFSLGSIIIIITRDKRILEAAKVDHCYEHTEMDYNQSLILFSKHAFRRDSPPNEFEGLTREVVPIAGGLPLSLEVFGSLLCGKDSTKWREMIKKLKKVCCMEVQEKLRINYEALDYAQKQMFLDIACFLIGTDKRIASYMWDACDFFQGEGVEVLRFMSLIKVGDDHELIMHDQLRDLGRTIIYEQNQQYPQHRSRLWEPKEALEVLERNKGTDKIEAIRLSGGGSNTELQFKNLTSLRFLHVKSTHISGDFKDSMEELRWLQWPQFPMEIEVNNFHVKRLAVLELSCSEMDDKWEGWSYFKMAKNLKFLDLSYCYSLENTDFLSAFKNLEVLILNHCYSLRRIDSSIGDMEALLRLDLCWCQSLEELPAEIGKLEALEQLHLLGTKALSALPDIIGSLENLEILHISCSGIQELPNGIGRLTKLREFKAFNCEKLRGAREGGTSFKMAFQKNKSLNLSDCGSLENTDFLSAFKNLEVLILNNCWRLRRIDSSIGDMEALLRLELRMCINLKELPAEIGKLKALEQLLLSDTLALSTLPDNIRSLENLEILDIFSSGIEELPDSIGRLTMLRELIASNCKKMRGGMPESMSFFSSLRRLDFRGCSNLQSLPDLPPSLTYLGVTCQSRKLPSFSHLTHLKELQVYDCISLECIQALPSELPESLNTPFKLETLHVSNCESIKTLDVSQFMNIRTLSIERCSILLEVRGLDKLIYLEELTVKYCGFKRLDLPKSKCLKTLCVLDCNDLVEIQRLDRLEFLENLNISNCTSIERLDLSKSRSLRTLCAELCKELAEIQGLDRLEFLEELTIEGCTSNKRLDLPKSGRLKILEAGDCENLVEIQGLDRLEFLEKLRIIGCKSLKTDLALYRSCIYEKNLFETTEYGSNYSYDSDE